MKIRPLEKKMWENAVSQKQHGASFQKQGFEVLAVVPQWGWSVKLLNDQESVLLFASEVKSASEKFPELIKDTDLGVESNSIMLVERPRLKKPCVFSK